MKNKQPRAGAFTLVEVLVTVAVIAAVAGIATVSAIHLARGTGDKKLEQDVAALNRAVSVFQANGGKISSSWKEAKIVSELKTKATDASAATLVGLSGTMLDSRIEVVMESYTEALSGRPKALWDAEKQRFYISTSPARGVKELRLNDRMSETVTAQRNRESNLKYAAEDSWVWDFTDQPSYQIPARVTPVNTYVVENTNVSNGNQNSLARLNPPLASLGGGSGGLGGGSGSGSGGLSGVGVYELADLEDLTLTLSNGGNPEEASEILYSVDGGSTWITYTEPIEVTPGLEIAYYTQTENAETYESSESLTYFFNVDPIQLVVSLDVEKPAYTYAEMGGPLMAGAYSITTAAPALAALLNDDIPASYLNSDQFELRWTYDASSPLDSNTAIAQEAFDGSFSAQQLPVNLGVFGNSTNMPIKVAAVSKNEALFVSSPETTRTIQVTKTKLRKPTLNLLGPGNMPARDLSFSFVTDFGDMPEGAEIYFTTNGSDPTRSDFKYEGVFSGLFLPQIRAKVFPPLEYEDWFLASDTTTVTIDPNQWVLSGNASGAFSNAEGGSGLTHHFDWVGGNSNNGHGNNADGVDVSNPGQGNGGPNGQIDLSGPIDDEIRGPNGVGGNYFEWGTAYSNRDTANSTLFEGAAFNNKRVGDSFLLGDFSFTNGTIYLDTAATAVDFGVDISFFEGSASAHFDFTLDLLSTQNYGRDKWQDADYVWFTDVNAASPVSFFGHDYTLEVFFGQSTNQGFSTIDQFHTVEGKSATGELWGRIVSAY